MKVISISSVYNDGDKLTLFTTATLHMFNFSLHEMTEYD